jgi:hypothetical protein
MSIMTKDKREYSEVEEAILAHLFDNPGAKIGTYSLMELLRPDKDSPDGPWKTNETQRKAYEEVQFGIETLIKGKLAKGKRGGTPGNIEFNELQLTTNGEAEAIAQKRTRLAGENVKQLLDVVQLIRDQRES